VDVELDPSSKGHEVEIVLRVLKNRVLRIVYGFKREEITGGRTYLPQK
jgi:hypothetical protein